MINRSQCDECGSTIDFTVDEFHTDDSGDMHMDCHYVSVGRDAARFLAEYHTRYVRQSREQVQAAADRASHYRYGDREGDF